MLPDLDIQDEVAHRTAVGTGLSLAAHAQACTGFNAGRDLDRNGLRFDSIAGSADAQMLTAAKRGGHERDRNRVFEILTLVWLLSLTSSSPAKGRLPA